MSTLGGVCAAVLTPLTQNFEPDPEKAIAYYGRLLEGGCDALNVLGTSGEAMSLSVQQRRAYMHALVDGGLPVARMMVGTGAAALADAIKLTKAAGECAFAAALVMPPFYYKNPSDDGVLAYFDQLLNATGPRPGSIYLYNFPQASGTTFTAGLIDKLM
ncbi:MAG: dihydrodipicolinate synthase family protein, partial [Candidatus Eremiobacteraeota bacterium]|nr:dihydrodipicolinate synthase family protein [Candidatus Eremiobacteraeota bacterium]